MTTIFLKESLAPILVILMFAISFLISERIKKSNPYKINTNASKGIRAGFFSFLLIYMSVLAYIAISFDGCYQIIASFSRCMSLPETINSFLFLSSFGIIIGSLVSVAIGRSIGSQFDNSEKELSVAYFIFLIYLVQFFIYGSFVLFGPFVMAIVSGIIIILWKIFGKNNKKYGTEKK